MKTTCIVGLPGSGKTYISKEIVEKSNAILFDDISNLDLLKKCVKDGRKDIVINDPHFCFEYVREIVNKKISKWSKGNVHIDWVFFENNPEKCWENVKRRNDQRKITQATIKFFSKFYQIPDSVETLEVWELKDDRDNVE